jgi:hypothetical protein
VHATPTKPVLHGDNGATLKPTTVLAMLAWLGITPSYSRPRVSDDNPFVEALFRTAKYRPAFPLKGFADLDAARQWAAGFVHWYNHEHHHSGIRYVTPAERHAGRDRELLDQRPALYQEARERNPRRWSAQTRNWRPIAAVTLNPEPFEHTKQRGGINKGHYACHAATCLTFTGSGKAERSTSTAMLRGTPGRREISPSRSSVSGIW